MDAAKFVSKNYYNQHPRLLEFVLSKPPDRVKYTNLALRKADFEEIEALAVEAGVIEKDVIFEDYTDASFVPDDSLVKASGYEGLKGGEVPPRK